MKRLFQFLMASALVVSMMGCSESPTSTEPEDPATVVQLRLKGNIAAITPSSRVNESGFEADDKVGVYVSSTGTLSSSNNMLDNEGFTYSGGNIEAPEGKEVYWGTPDVRLSVWAYYPYVESITDNVAYPFSVKTDQSSAENFYGSDFITASATNLPPQSEPIDLTFNHSLSKIEITLAAGTGITADELIAATKSLYINGAIVDGTINLSNGVATVGTTASSVTPFKTGDLAYSAIVYPQQSELTFRFEMGEDVYSYTTNVDYTAGHRYKYKFTINTRDPQEMTLTAVSINAWEDDGEEENVEMSDIITFTDPKFKEYLLTTNLYSVQQGSNGSNVYVDSGRKIDLNNDGEISIAEAESVSYIDMYGLGVTDLSGIEYFVNLEYLSCVNSYYDYENDEHVLVGGLSTINVSKNTALVYLNCRSNQLTSLDVSNNTSLTYLNCISNQLSTLDLSNNTALERLSCDYNQLTTLDVSKNTALKELGCSYNSISSLDLTNNSLLESLSCWSNDLSSLDITKNTKLIYLQCGANDLTTLDVSKNTALIEIDCSANELRALDVLGNVNLKKLYCHYNQIEELDLSNNSLLEGLLCHVNNLTLLDVSNNTALMELWCYENQLGTLDLTKNTALVSLDCQKNKLTSLDVSKNTNLLELFCSPMNDAEENNLLTTIYIADGQEITTLEKPEATQIVEKE